MENKPRYYWKIILETIDVGYGIKQTLKYYTIWDCFEDVYIQDETGQKKKFELILNEHPSYDVVAECNEMNREWLEQLTYNNLITEYLKQ